MSNYNFQMATDSLNSNSEHSDAAVVITRPHRPSNIWLIIVASLFIVVPFLTWYLTWFGRGLSDQELATYLSDQNNPRHIQHALMQVEAKIEKADPNAKQFYPQIISASLSPVAEVRKTAAWVMGQDNKSEEFHGALAKLLKDEDPLVRRNAALQLVRFGDGSGREELRSMLMPFDAKSPVAGTIVGLLPVNSSIRAGGMLARIRDAANNIYEFRSPLDGKIAYPPVTKERDQIAVNQTVARLVPDRATIIDSLRALAYVGSQDDLEFIENAARIDPSTEVTNLSAQTIKAIRARSQAAGQ
jgi:HEAT repeat protein